MGASKNQPSVIKDRNLGDEWVGWTGEIEEKKGALEESKSTFLKYASISITLMVAGLLLIWYMIIPRLDQFAPILTILTGAGILIFSIAIFVMLGSITITVLTEKGYLLSCIKENLFFSFLVPLAVRIGKRFGISRDRMGNSLIKVSNIIVNAKSKSRPDGLKIEPDKLLVLLPRCLSKETRKSITEIVERNNTVSYTATGGSSALLTIKKMRPHAIIAVACERDLVSGLKDVAPKIPVIAIPNKRPEGPCKNTNIEIEALTTAIKGFLGPG